MCACACMFWGGEGVTKVTEIIIPAAEKPGDYQDSLSLA